MPFKHGFLDRKKYGLTPLIDMVFLLLIFFLVTSYVGTGVISEQKLLVPTPIQKEGEMNILIQLYKSNNGDLRCYYIDYTINQVYRRIVEGREYRFGTLSTDPKVVTDRVFQVIKLDYDLSINALKSRLQELTSSTTSLFIGVRCPYDVPYFEAVEITSIIPTTSRYGWPIRYGFIEGEKETLFSANIRPEWSGNRINSILIDLQ